VSDANHVRASFYDLDYDSTAVAKAGVEHAEDAELKHWALALGDLDTIHPLYEKAMEDDPHGAWTLLARGRYVDPWESKAVLDEAIQAAPSDTDVLVIATRDMVGTLYEFDDKEGRLAHRSDIVAFLQEHASQLEGSAHGLAALAEGKWMLEQSSEAVADRTAQDGEIIALADKALAEDSHEAQAVLAKSSVYNADGKKQANAEMLRGFLELGTRAFPVYQAYMKAVLGTPGVNAAEQRKQLLWLTNKLLDQGEPNRFHTLTMIFESKAANADTISAMEDAIVKRYPDSAASDTVLYMQASADDPNLAVDPNAPEKIDALQAYLDLPKHADPVDSRQARERVLQMLVKQPQPDIERIYKLLKATDQDGEEPDHDAIITLAEHKVHLPEIEIMAQKQLDAKPTFLSSAMLRQWDKQGFYEFGLADFVGPWQRALGVVYMNEGKLKQAQLLLEAAVKAGPDSLANQLQLGHLYDAKGEYAKAQETYTKALSMVYVGSEAHPAVAALRDNYLLQHPDKVGLDGYMKEILVKDTDRRRMAVLKARSRAPVQAPNATLKTLDGRTVSISDLKGKVVVINFWATWCGPCREELPDFEKLYEKYRNDPNVMILSMSVDSADTPVATISNFIKKYHYDFPVLLGATFGPDNHVAPIPMTWFIDPSGKEDYRKIGYTKELVQEFTWRIDSLLPTGTGAASSTAKLGR
jgi:thiol-disulfide isomerase/thioredoxin